MVPTLPGLPPLPAFPPSPPLPPKHFPLIEYFSYTCPLNVTIFLKIVIICYLSILPSVPCSYVFLFSILFIFLETKYTFFFTSFNF